MANLAAPRDGGWRQRAVGRLRERLRRRLQTLYAIGHIPAMHHEFRQWRDAAAGSALARLAFEYRGFGAVPVIPFVCARWSAPQRVRRMIDHCRIVDELGPPFVLGCDEYVEMLDFELGNQPCRFVLDRAPWFRNDGLLTASLWAGADRLFSISFCLGDTAQGRTAWIGGIQGRSEPAMTERYRGLTRLAHGMRPRDLAFELFRMLMPHLGVARICAVTNDDRYHRTRRAFLALPPADRVLLDYDAIWRDRGGAREAGGFFALPLRRSERAHEAMPGGKRAMYRRRYAMLDALEAGIAAGLRQGLPVHRHSPDA